MHTFGFLPSLSSAAEAASFSHSVLPFYSSSLDQVFDSSNPVELYKTTNPFVFGSFLSVLISLIVFPTSVLTGNWSWVDRLWSVLPVIYSLHYLIFAWIHELLSPRLSILFVLQLSWSARLTFNYWRKGGYQRGSEDYRWVNVRKLITSPFPHALTSTIQAVFNLVFISLIQNILLFALTAPNYLMFLVGSHTPLTYQDAICAGWVIIFLALETVADEQQWIFQQAKHAAPAKSTRSHVRQSSQAAYCQPEDLQRGFIAGGLFKYSRHPNFASEQAIWFLFYLFGCVATKTWWNWTVFAPLALSIVIFMGSTILTESITSQKYPAYRLYQQKVPKFIPLPGYYWDETNAATKSD